MDSPTKDATLRHRLTGLRDCIIAGIHRGAVELPGAANYLDSIQVVDLLSAMLDDRASFNGATATNTFAHAELRARRVADREQTMVTWILGLEWDAPVSSDKVADAVKAAVDPTGDVAIKHVRGDDVVLYVTDNMADPYNWTQDICEAARFSSAALARTYAKNIVGVGTSIAITIIPLPPHAVLKLWADVEWQQCFLHCRPTQGIVGAVGDPAVLNRPATLLDVVEVIAVDVRRASCEHTSYEGVFKLKDGRYLFVCNLQRDDGWALNTGHRLTAMSLQGIKDMLTAGSRFTVGNRILNAVNVKLALTPFA